MSQNRRKSGFEYIVRTMSVVCRAYIKDRLYVIPALVLHIYVIPGALGITYIGNTLLVSNHQKMTSESTIFAPMAPKIMFLAFSERLAALWTKN